MKVKQLLTNYIDWQKKKKKRWEIPTKLLGEKGRVTKTYINTFKGIERWNPENRYTEI